MSVTDYIGRFAPSPTGPLHFGSLVAALASYADARAHGGRWLLRIEDVDSQRCRAAHAHEIFRQLAAYGFAHDGEVTFQSQRIAHYAAALNLLRTRSLAYPCTCTRKQLADAPRNTDGEIIYPGTCRVNQARDDVARAWRLDVAKALTTPHLESRTAQHQEDDAVVATADRVFGTVKQNVPQDVGDFVVWRADGDVAYQLAVVVDDHLQGVTHVVRGADLLLNTPRQIALQRVLGYETPSYLHVPIATNSRGEKLSKQTEAAALETDAPSVIANLRRAWAFLGQSPIAATDAADAPSFLQLAQLTWDAKRIAGRIADKRAD